jgi:uncharacterized cupin superfamily protein
MVIFGCFGGLIFVIEKQIKFESARDDLSPAPIDPSWIREGHPLAREKYMSGSSDGTTNTYIWDCTAGRFNWHYIFDETACILDGSVVVKDERGVPRTMRVGDTMFFPTGSSAEWTVNEYVRKVAVLRHPLSPPVVLLSRIVNRLNRLIRRGRSAPKAAAEF